MGHRELLQYKIVIKHTVVRKWEKSIGDFFEYNIKKT